MAHTPGPWELDTAGWPLIVNGPECEGDEANVVCTIETADDVGSSRHNYTMGLALGNAQLIRVAPALLNALDAVLECIEQDPRNVADGDVPTYYICGQIHEALATAVQLLDGIEK